MLYHVFIVYAVSILSSESVVLTVIDFTIHHSFFFQLFRRFGKLLLCLSHTRTISFLDKLGKGHDAAVLGWKAAIQQEMDGSKVDNPHPIQLNWQHVYIFGFNCIVAG